jgi:general secretion pathway protein I
LCRSTCRKRGCNSAGFTLIEVVITLAVIATILVSVGSLVGATVRGSRALDNHLALIETARTIQTGLPDRTSLKPGILSGATAGQSWRVDVRPFPGMLDARSPTLWVPLTATVTMQAPDGTSLKVTTLRLHRRPPE